MGCNGILLLAARLQIVHLSQLHLAAVEGQQALALHLGEGIAQGAAVNAQVVGQLLTVKGRLNCILPLRRASTEKYAVMRPRIVLGAVYRLRWASPRFLRAAIRSRFWVIFQRHGSQPHRNS